MQLAVHKTVLGSFPAKRYQQLLDTTLASVPKKSLPQWSDGLSLAFIGDARMRRLAAYKGASHADVLSFDYGEIVVCVPSARRQANRHAVSLVREFDLLFVHGLLHLFNFDHEKQAARTRMQAMEHFILGAPGLITRQGYETV